ncbi:hypothetical protein H5410_022501 [Solanum commersonii]|uniref:DUF7903 domain-containing protein n=1 Tax=Solanum commersonii TaxID=4109 RepID=A0A9J5ZI41_SOLCO|nr:hypothetical protein H5410_022501 [Solanum commersonii]
MKREMAQVKPSVVARFGKILFYRLQPNSTVSCKCTVAKDYNKIEISKIELNRVRHMVADMSCLGKSSDLRLILYTKKINMILSDEEINGIKDLIGSAILDSEVQGGLRVEMAHWQGFFRFKLRHADPFDFKSSAGEVTQEIILKMSGIISEFRKQTMDEDLMFEMLENNLKLIWDLCLLDGSSS